MIFRSKTSPEFFEDRYQQKTDPWNFVGSDYEQNRFATIAAALSHQRYRCAMEPGCSIGTLTERLAGFCDEVIASDFSATAVERAKARCAALPNVRISCGALSRDTAMSGYDLIIFSEIGYYFDPKQWRKMVSHFVQGMDPGTTVLASHWLGETNEHRQSGDEVHAAIRAVPGLRLEHEERHVKLRLDRFVKA